MGDWLTPTSNKHGLHQYDLEQFGLTPADIERIFGEYQDRFAVPSVCVGGDQVGAWTAAAKRVMPQLRGDCGCHADVIA